MIPICFISKLPIIFDNYLFVLDSATGYVLFNDTLNSFSDYDSLRSNIQIRAIETSRSNLLWKLFLNVLKIILNFQYATSSFYKQRKKGAKTILNTNMGGFVSFLLLLLFYFNFIYFIFFGGEGLGDCQGNSLFSFKSKPTTLKLLTISTLGLFLFSFLCFLFTCNYYKLITRCV